MIPMGAPLVPALLARHSMCIRVMASNYFLDVFKQDSIFPFPDSRYDAVSRPSLFFRSPSPSEPVESSKIPYPFQDTDEFTFEVSDETLDVLEKTFPPERAEMYIARLAERHDDWRRIHAVERLASTRNPDIKAWLLREGFRNVIDVNYLALICAEAGDLIGALRQESIDAELLEGAGEILESLRVGGPGDFILAYADGAEATNLWLGHLAKSSAATLWSAYYAYNTRLFARQYALPGWSAEIREEIARRAGTVLALPIWRERVAPILSQPDHSLFWLALEVADIIGMDVWDIRYEQMLRHGKGNWFGLFRAGTAERLHLSITLAAERAGIKTTAAELYNAMESGEAPDTTETLIVILHSLAILPFWREEFWPLVEAGLAHSAYAMVPSALGAMEGLEPSSWPDAVTAIIRKLADTAVTKNDREQYLALLEDRPPGGIYRKKRNNTRQGLSRQRSPWQI